MLHFNLNNILAFILGEFGHHPVVPTISLVFVRLGRSRSHVIVSVPNEVSLAVTGIRCPSSTAHFGLPGLPLCLPTKISQLSNGTDTAERLN
jgi:hypothetical protein